jgi:hypothetical protein
MPWDRPASCDFLTRWAQRGFATRSESDSRRRCGFLRPSWIRCADAWKGFPTSVAGRMRPIGWPISGWRRSRRFSCRARRFSIISGGLRKGMHARIAKPCSIYPGFPPIIKSRSTGSARYPRHSLQGGVKRSLSADLRVCGLVLTVALRMDTEHIAIMEPVRRLEVFTGGGHGEMKRRPGLSPRSRRASRIIAAAVVWLATSIERIRGRTF